MKIRGTLKRTARLLAVGAVVLGFALVVAQPIAPPSIAGGG